MKARCPVCGAVCGSAENLVFHIKSAARRPDTFGHEGAMYHAFVNLEVVYGDCPTP